MSELSALMDYDRKKVLIAENNKNVRLKSPIRSDKKKFQQVFFKEFRLSSIHFGNKWFMDKAKRIIEFSYAEKFGPEVILYGYEVENKTAFFTEPVNSSVLDIYSADIINHRENNLIACTIENIKCKMICISVGSRHVFQPLLHTLS